MPRSAGGLSYIMLLVSLFYAYIGSIGEEVAHRVGYAHDTVHAIVGVRGDVVVAVGVGHCVSDGIVGIRIGVIELIGLLYQPVHGVILVFYPLVFPVGGEGQVPVGVVRVGAVASQRVGCRHQIVVGVVSTRRNRPLVLEPSPCVQRGVCYYCIARYNRLKMTALYKARRNSNIHSLLQAFPLIPKIHFTTYGANEVSKTTREIFPIKMRNC